MADPETFVDRRALSDKDFAAAEASIENRLGWLEAPDRMRSEAGPVEAFARDLAADGLTDIYLLGMGGSSLCAEVVRDVLGTGPSRLTVLDTTDEATIARVTRDLVPARAFFIVASKSGGTIEVTSLEAHFWSVMTGAVGAPGRHFCAITDDGTALVTHAATRGYRETFINPSDIGGRFSALSLFGLVPACLAGVAPGTLLTPAVHMASQCRENSADNPGLALGVFVGSHAAAGRDKMTLLTSAPLAPFGVWVEQLVAESTGKRGFGALPVVDEPIGPVAEYGHDRAFVVMMTKDDLDLARQADALETAGHPVFRIATEPSRLGAEFFRWEFATAVAGAVLRVNPFDEPDVRKAKVFTKEQLDAHEATGHFKVEPAFTAEANRGVRRIGSGWTPAKGYIAILDFLPVDTSRAEVVARVRAAIRRRLGVATTYGYGPRYLHSTGQYHKGGPNTGRFLILTSLDENPTPVPGQPYSFSVLKCAQGFGDFEALKEQNRNVIHCHFERPPADIAAAIEAIVDELL